MPNRKTGGNGEDKRLRTAYAAVQAAMDVSVKKDFDAHFLLNDSPLHRASKAGKYKTCESLIAAGADVNGKGLGGGTALHRAAEFGRVKTCMRLLRAGGNLMAKDIYGYTPLHWAAWGGSASACDFLIAVGADPKCESRDGETPLHRARTAKACEALVKVGADVEALDADGRTPLHHIARAAATDHMAHGAAGACRYLFGRGANPLARDVFGLTPEQNAGVFAQDQDEGIWVFKAMFESCVLEREAYATASAVRRRI